MRENKEMTVIEEKKLPDFLWRRQRESDRGRTRLDGSRGVIIPALDLDPESDFQLFEDSGTGF